nr:cancer/testis antigen 55-like [Peromyscus maniculatus bairdii]
MALGGRSGLALAAPQPPPPPPPPPPPFSKPKLTWGVSTMLRIMSQIFAFFRRRKIDSQEKERAHRQGEGNFKSVQGVVTSYSGNYGWIESLISSDAEVLTGDVPLRVQQTVTTHVEFQNTGGLKATKVDVVPDKSATTSPSSHESRALVGHVTCVKKTMVYVENKISFSISRVIEGFTPYRGDWLEVEYIQLRWTSKLHVLSAKPIKVKHLQEVYITFLEGRHGMIEYAIFFTLDSLKLPPGYEPKVGDVVNVTIVESVHLSSVWRAISMSPVERS